MGGNIRLLRESCLVLVAMGLVGCGDVTGNGPRIGSAEEKKQETDPAATAVHRTTATPEGGWNEIAHNAFAEPATTVSSVVAITDPATTQPSTTTSVAPSTSTAPSPVLADSSSLYLRQGQSATVFWQPWASEAFKEAKTRNAPILIVIGAAWNHQAQMMDSQVFSDAEVSRAINTGFVSIRVDGDERPDIWARYRMAYEVINKERATMPLIVFALPDGRPFDVLSSVPAHANGSNAGMVELLSQASNLFTQQTEAVNQQAASIETVLTKLLTEPRIERAGLSAALIDGLGSALESAAIGVESDALRAGRVAETLLTIAAAAGNTSNRNAASELLLSRFRSGQRDHVLGGYFFRTPGDATIQFGKLLPVQTEMITANAHAYAATGKTLHKEGVTEILRFCQDWLEAPEGGFFSGQAPDMGGDDAGGYFTWTREEIAAIAGDEKDATVFSEYLNAKTGEKTNLHVTGKLQQAADAAGVSYAEANEALNTVRKKLRDARMAAEQAPAVDKSILAGWNGDMICAYMDAAEFIGDDAAKAFALKTADMIIESMVSEQEGVAHVMHKGRASGFGYLEDNVKVAAGLARCYEITNQREYLDSAISLMEYVEARFLDKESGLYQDALNSADAQGLLKLKRYPLEDDITRSANAVAAIMWAKLARAENKDDYKKRAERMVNAAAERRAFNSEAVATWGEAAAIVQYGIPAYKK